MSLQFIQIMMVDKNRRRRRDHQFIICHFAVYTAGPLLRQQNCLLV